MNFDQFDFLKDYFNLASTGSSLQALLVNSLVLIAMVSLLSLVYVKTAATLSNRKRLAAIFPLLSLTTMMVISVIQTSLALSLGLVGALSIVRFRSAIKEPEELTYIFLAISLGLGMGANQQELTITFFVLVMIYLLVRNFLQGRLKLFDARTDQSFYLTVSFPNQAAGLKELVSVLERYCHYIELKRAESDAKITQHLFVVKIADHKQLAAVQAELKQLSELAEISLVNDENLFG